MMSDQEEKKQNIEKGRNIEKNWNTEKKQNMEMKQNTGKKQVEEQGNLDMERSDAIHFMQEKMKERPVNRKKLLRRTIITVSLAVVFGIVACIPFLLLEPVISKMLYPEEKPQVVTFPTEEEEVLPEDMAIDDSELEISGQKGENLQLNGSLQGDQPLPEPEAIPEDAQKPLSIESYYGLFEEMSALTKEIQTSMVTVTAVSSDTNWINDTLQNEGTTSGVIVADNGKELLILAKCEKLLDADSISVAFCDGANKDATIKEMDKMTGFGILAVPFLNLSDSTLNTITYATLGSSLAAPLTGRPVIAVGAPIGIVNSVCYGTVTSEGTALGLTDSNYKIMTTDIAGSKNGSGVLVNLTGQVVGIIYDKYVSENVTNQICAIGISELKKTIEKMSNGDSMTYLGLHGAEINNDIRSEFDIPYGAYITGIEIDSPAMKAGIQSGDIIVKVDHTEVVTFGELVSFLNKTKKDQVLTLTIARQGQDQYQEMQLEVIVGEQP